MSVKYIDPSEIKDYLAKEWNLIDIRPASEFRKQKYGGSVNLPFRGNPNWMQQIANPRGNKASPVLTGVILISEGGKGKDVEAAGKTLSDWGCYCVIVRGGFSAL